MCDYVGTQRVGAGFFAVRIQETRACECKIRYVLIQASLLFHYLYISQWARGKKGTEPQSATTTIM